ncbi:cytochrome P450 [Lentzea sp. NPDC060358]|uniref:cytochrome P450 n=1 Tax=Lentzea sp. NPDC060358 TaxID=3347103 RepID=UPI003646D37A
MTGVAGDLVDGATYLAGQPFPLWQRMREHTPVLWHEPGDFPGFWSVTGYDDVRTVLRDPGLFSSAAGILLRPTAQGADPGGGRTMALSDPPRHTVLRDAIAGHFSPRHLRSLQAELDDAAQRIVRQAVAAGTVDFVTGIAATLPVEVVCAFLGLPEADRGQITGWTTDAFCAGTAWERSVAHMKILDYFTTLVRRRRDSGGTDLVSVLASVELDGRPLPVEEVVLNCDNLLVGGTENTRLAMSGGVLALARHPGQWELLRTRFDEVADTAIDEVLRWTSSATHLARTATGDTVLGGTAIGAGDLVVCWLPSANRDPRQFPDPDVFDLRRTPNRHLALGAGPHYCVGTRLARAEMRAILRELTEQVSRIELAGEPELLDSIVVNGLRALPLTLVP